MTLNGLRWSQKLSIGIGFYQNSSENIWIKEYYKVNPTSGEIVSNVIFDDSLPQMYVFCNCQY